MYLEYMKYILFYNRPIHPSNVPWVHHPLVSNAHFNGYFSMRLCLVTSFSESIFPRHTIPLYPPAILFLVFLVLISLPSPRRPPPLPVWSLPFYRCVQISLISFP